MALTVGREEWVGLPDLGIPAIRAKVDTGAQTSSLHAFAIHRHDVRGKARVRFGVHPLPEHPDVEIYCEADLLGEREITSSNGARELRFIVAATLEIAGHRRPIEISLTNRESMAYRMLLGRQALRDVIVDVSGTCLQGARDLGIYEALRHARHAERPLSIALIVGDPASVSAMRLEETGRARGHDIITLAVARCRLDYTGGDAALHHRGKPVARPEAVIPLPAGAEPAAVLAVLRFLERRGARTLNTSAALSAATDPMRTVQILHDRRLDSCAAVLADAARAGRALADIGGVPVYVRGLRPDAAGEPLFAASEQAARRALRRLEGPVLLQHAGPEGRLRRCLVIGRRVVAALGLPPSPSARLRRPRRQGRPTKEERRLARRAARALGMQAAVVDLLSRPEGPAVLDVGPLEEIESFENAAGLDAAAVIFEQLERLAGRRGVGTGREGRQKLS